MRACWRAGGSLWRMAIAVALSLLGPPAASPAPTPAEVLQARFPVVRGRFSIEVRLEAVSWRIGSRPMEGFRAPFAAGADASPRDRARVRFPALASDLFVVEGEGVRVALRPIGARAVRASPEPGALLYPGAYRDTDAWNVPTAEWTEEYLHLRSRRAPRAFTYEILETSGVTSVSLDNGDVRFLDAGGRGLVALAPVVVDAAGRRSATAARWDLGPGRSGGRRLTLRLDPTGLEYPLLVDPTWITTGSMATARLDGIGILLQTGQVLVMAGAPNTQTTAELYDPATGTWAAAPSMPAPGRGFFAAVLLRDGRVLVAGGFVSGGQTSTCRLYNPASNTWTTAANMRLPRESFTLTLLPDGRVLAAGGESPTNSPLSSVETYDPAANTWTFTGSLSAPKSQHSAVALRDGRVLAAGGVTPSLTRISEIYDPATGLWTRVGDMVVAHYQAIATLLPDGRVLAAGGSLENRAETFDPGSGTWTATNALSVQRGQASATLLPNGRVLVAGGSSGSVWASTELYNPATGTWAPGPALSAGRFRHSATMLPNGRVLVAGGFNAVTLATAELLEIDDAAGWAAGPDMSTPRQEHSVSLLKNGKVLVVGGVGLDTAETWDPALNTWSPTGNAMAARRWRHTATVLVNGQVLVAGTESGVVESRTAELYDPSTDRWTLTGQLITNRYSHSATLLPCGEVLVTGGESSSGVILRKSERYNPPTGTWKPTSDINAGRWAHTATLLKDGKVLVTGGWNGGTLASAEIYDPVNETWTPTAGNMTQPRYHHQATLLPNGKVLISGGSFVSSTAELFNPATGTFAAADGLNFGHDTGFTATLLPDGKVLVTGGFANSSRAELFDPVATALGTWTTTADLTPTRNYHTAVLLLDGRVMVAGGDAITATTAFYDVGRGELPGWRPVLTGASDPLVTGSPLAASGSSLTGLGEGSSGLGYMHSATNYPLVQLRRLDSELVSWLPVDPAAGWSGSSFRSLPVNGFAPGPALVTVFTNGIPSASKVVTVECPPPTVTGQPTSQAVCEGAAASFTSSASGDCPSFQWYKDASPVPDGGRISGARTTTLAITGALPSDSGSYEAAVSLACSPTVATSSAVTLTVTPTLSGVSASLSGPNSVCSTCLGGTASESHSGGGAASHQWGYRTTSGGAITLIPGATSPTYVLNGTDFPGPGTYFLVVSVTASCGSALSNEVGVGVDNSPPPGDEVRLFTVTSRSGENVLEWINPPADGTVNIRFTGASTSCAFPASETDGAAVPGGSFAALANAHERLVHSSLVNASVYCYSIFYDGKGPRTNSGRPFDTSGNVKWAFNSGLFSTTPPTVGGAGVIVTNNDNAVHAMARGGTGGEWPPGWRPVLLGGAVQGRSPVVPIPVGTANPVVFLGAQDGLVYAVDGTSGGAGPAPWGTPTTIASLVQAAPAGMFTAFGGVRDALFVGTRDAGANNALVALAPGNGIEIDRFDNGGGANRIGIISGSATVDYGRKRVYFASDTGGSANTLWCVEIDDNLVNPPFKPLLWARPLGRITSSPVIRGDRVYVATDAGTLYSIHESGAAGLDRTLATLDGGVKGFVFPDRSSGDLYFATNNLIKAATDTAGGLGWKWSSGSAGVAPSPVLYVAALGKVYFGGSDGRLYELDASNGAATSVPLGDGTAAVGAPSYDLVHGLVHVGTAAGIFYAVQVPLP